jgi:phosphopantothenoylcysteine synthetase/decarboxylase
VPPASCLVTGYNTPMSTQQSPLAGKTIILGVTASIAAYKAADLCSRLVKAGANVRVLMTRNATKMVGPATTPFQWIAKPRWIARRTR